jgi:hypothetical protein
MVANGKVTRNADYRHAQSIGRQRQAAQRVAADVSAQDLAEWSRDPRARGGLKTLLWRLRQGWEPEEVVAGR